MGGRKQIKCLSCKRIRVMLNNFYIDWSYRRHSWRASFFYNCLTGASAFSIVFTLVFQQLIKSFNFFMNYSCDHRSINFMLRDLLIFLIISSLICILSFFLSRMCSILSNYTISDFMSLGKWINSIGCTVKWFPWALAILFILWFLINIFNLGSLYVKPNLWCKPRLNIEATFAVNNCRIFEGRRTKCTQNFIEQGGSASKKTIRKCNDLNYLRNNKYFVFIPDLEKPTYTSCDFVNFDVCKKYLELLLDPSSHEKDKVPEGCLEKVPTKIEDFFDKKIYASDLYRYAQLFIIGGNVTFSLFVFFFYFLKRTTQFDGLFYQPGDNSENILLQMLRPLTPWS